MSKIELLRIGSRDAPRWINERAERATGLLLSLLACGAALVAIASLTDAVTDDNRPRVWGAVIGISISVLIAFVLWALWMRLWRALRRAFKFARSTNPGALVLAGRIPTIQLPPGDPFEAVESSLLAPRQIVILASPEALKVRDTDGHTLAQLKTEDIRSVEVVEYVEAGRAYNGVAVLVGPGLRGLVFQPVAVGPVWAKPAGLKLSRAHAARLQFTLGMNGLNVGPLA